MAATAATIQPTALKLGGAEALENQEEDLEDVFITDLDRDYPSSSDDGERSLAATDNAVTASINAEWRRLKQSADDHQKPAVVMEGLADAEESVDGGQAGRDVVKMQPRRLSEADVFLRPSQVEEMLGQNSLLLEGTSTSAATRRNGFSPSSYMLSPQVLNREDSNASSTATAGSLQAEDPAMAAHPPLSPPNSRRGSGSALWDGFMACISPVVGMVKKKESGPLEKKDPWEIPFADIRELSFIGSGSQGAVFVGEYLKEKVAVKKVKDLAYCQEARHLRKLRHPNVVQFR